MNRLVVVLTIGMLFAAAGCEELGTTSQPNKDVERLSAEVEQLSVEVERLAEQQQQTAQLLETLPEPAPVPTAEPTETTAEPTPTPEVPPSAAQARAATSTDIVATSTTNAPNPVPEPEAEAFTFLCPERSPRQGKYARWDDIQEDLFRAIAENRLAERAAEKILAYWEDGHHTEQHISEIAVHRVSGLNIRYYRIDGSLQRSKQSGTGLGDRLAINVTIGTHAGDRTDTFTESAKVEESSGLCRLRFPDRS